MQELHIDLETFSSEPLAGQKAVGLYKYVQAHDFQILLFGFAFDDDDVRVIDLAQGEHIPIHVQHALFNPDIVKCAFNALFEWYCLGKFFGLDEAKLKVWLTQWFDIQLQALYCGLPHSLDMVGRALHLSDKDSKDKSGKALIQLFSVPTRPTQKNGDRTRTLPHHEPAKWALYIKYNAQDVVTERIIMRKLRFWPVPDFIRQQWVYDAIINLEGVRVDQPLMHAALALDAQINEELTARGQEITGLLKPNSSQQLKQWVENLLKQEQDDEDFELENFRKETVAEIEVADPLAVEMLKIRSQLNKTSVAKFKAMFRALCADGRLRGMFQFYGASTTGRDAGRIVQLQNMARSYIKDLSRARWLVLNAGKEAVEAFFGNAKSVLSQLTRVAIIPDEGELFVDADYHSIEAVVLSWEAECKWRMDIFNTHGKMYEMNVQRMYGVPFEDVVEGNPAYELRGAGKVAELACGYQGWEAAIARMPGGNKFTEQERIDIADKWRKANPEIVALWKAYENAALHVVQYGGEFRVNKVIFAREHSPEDKDLWFLTILLPSGRKIHYLRPTIGPGKKRYSQQVMYEGMTRGPKRIWGTVNMYGGLFTENITQAIARDCLFHAIGLLIESGRVPRIHVHDEILLSVAKERAAEEQKEIKRIMEIRPPWAQDLPLTVDTWVDAFYRK